MKLEQHVLPTLEQHVLPTNEGIEFLEEHMLVDKTTRG